MKRLIPLLAAMAIALSMLAPAWAITRTATFTQTLDTSTKTSDSFDPSNGGQAFGFTVGVTGTFVANWRLQRSIDGGTTWVDFIVLDQADIIAIPTQSPALWRVSAAAGSDFTSGSAAVTFLQGGQQAATPATRIINYDRTVTGAANPLPVATPKTISVTASQTVTAALYTSRNAVGGKITFAGATRVAAQGGIFQSCILRDKAGQAVSYDLLLFNADPSSTTVTDKSAVALNTADLGKQFGTVQFSGIVLGAASTMGTFTAAGLGQAFKLPAGTSVYGILVVTGAPTYASTSDVSLECFILPD